MQLDDSTLDDVLARLRRVEGQIGGIIKMIEGGRECRDVISQISAASTALDRAGFRILASGLRRCAADPGAAAASGYSQDELERMFTKLA